MALFDIDFSRLNRMVLPPRLRNGNMLAWLNVLTAPVAYLYGLFTANRQANLYTLAHTSQVIKMQAALNDTFDSAYRRIAIADAAEADPIYIYEAAESKPVHLYTAAEHKPGTLYTYRETQTGVYDFIVQVPSGVSYDANRMKALTDRYRLPSKTNYKIVTI